ncbi:unnamed protein product [Vitrella brassicaformis CCMP3155]|uniref:Uncharacterized protein n=1 Tax=Vitrella brassicaformis (strain CCMP3155) TaxID=1169540 RepID=A0A0G4E9S1_VITBC|nr:unnamed protein product [Vitrella brassicaformis CCMP3155]|eukprot:CEL92184.1 unnamed protein product [Vitrella brassicaformis CCMP3155]
MPPRRGLMPPRPRASGEDSFAARHNISLSGLQSSSQTNRRADLPLHFAAWRHTPSLTVHIGFGFCFPTCHIAAGLPPAHISQSLMASDSVPSLWALSLKTVSHTLDDLTRRPALVTQIDKQPSTEIPRGVTLPAVLQQRIERAIHEEGLHDLLAFDIPDVAGALRTTHVLERCSGHWKVMKPFIRLAFIYRLSPNATRPLVVSADSLPTASAFDELLLTMAAYKTFGHLLSYKGTSLALQRASNGAYRIGDHSFRVVPLGDLPADHAYRSTYKDSDPVIRRGDYLYPSFTTFIKRMVLEWCDQEGVEEKLVTGVNDVGRDDSHYQSLLTAPTIEGYKTVDYIDEHTFVPGDDGRLRIIILKGTAADDTIAAYLLLENGQISLWTTEAATEGSTGIERYPIAVAAARPLLGKYGLERTVLRQTA